MNTRQNQIDENLLAVFIESAKNVATSVELIPANAESLNKSLLALIQNEPVLFAEPDDLPSELFSTFKSNKNVIIEPTKEQLSNIKISITDAFCAIASTGSVCVSVTKNLSSVENALSRKHIVVVNADTIIPRPRDIFSVSYLNGKGLSRSFSIITGPSATADMGPLVKGVHGPGKLHIIILE